MVLWIMLNLSKGKYQRSLCHGIVNLPTSSSSTIRVVIFPGPGPSLNLQRPGHYTTLWLCSSWRSWISKSEFSPIQLRTIKSQQFGDFGNVRIGSTSLNFVNSSILYFLKKCQVSMMKSVIYGKLKLFMRRSRYLNLVYLNLIKTNHARIFWNFHIFPPTIDTVTPCW